MLKRKKLVELKGLSKHFKLRACKVIKAVDDVSFDIYEGETFGLVGETGSGKTTIARTIIRLLSATSGEVWFDGELISGNLPKEKKKDLCREMQMIFQDPRASLNPRMTVEEIISEGLVNHDIFNTPEDIRNRVYKLLNTVGLQSSHAKNYPHEFSGGQMQRIGIARALAIEPRLIIADEPISALDVAIQAQVVNLLNDLKSSRNLSYIFIAHDLAMVRYISDRVGVMNRGKMLELGDAEELYHNPLHDYTKSLISAIPFPDPRYERDRKRLHYDFQSHTYSKADPPRWIEVTEGHFVRASMQELAGMVRESEERGYKTVCSL